MSAAHAGVLPDAGAVRRADWRFLLPDPALGRVAYPAPRDRALFEALREVSVRVERPTVEELAGYDVVVITGGGRQAMDGAATAASPGTWIVAEASGHEAVAFAKRLRTRGFDEVTVHWMWPDASRCKEIIPLERRAVRHALHRRDPGARLRIRARVASLVAHTRLFPLAIGRAALVAKVPS